MKTIRHSLLFLLAVLLASSLARADFDAAGKAYAAGRYEEAFRQFQELARQGDHDAQFNIGAMLYRGEGVAADPVEGYAWVALAAQEGTDEKKNSARGKLLERLSGDDKQKALARSAELLAEYGDAAIIEKISPVMLPNAECEFELKRQSPIIAHYPDKMLNEYKTGWVDLSYTVARDGTTRNHGVVFFSDRAFVAGSVAAIKRVKYNVPLVNGKPADIHGVRLRVNYVLRGGRFSPYEVRRMMETQKQKALAGNAQDKYQYAYLLDTIPSYTDVSLEDKDANEWYWRSAKEGYTPSQFFIGRNLLYGKGCRAEPQKGAVWLTTAARKSQPDAQYLLAVELIAGTRMERDEQRAIELLERAAALNYSTADIKLAWIYATHPDASVRNGAKARAHLDRVADEYIDTVTLHETRAAASAEASAFKQAVDYQQSALDEARSLDFPADTIRLMEERLQHYRGGLPWRESI